MRLRNLLKELIFPTLCYNCETPGAYLCRDCKKLLHPHPECCPYCHKYSADYSTCLDCKIDIHHGLEGVIIPFSYTKDIKKLILNLKYHHQRYITDFLADRAILALQSNQKINNSPLIISYIPSHRYKKHFIKGYNQSQLLAEAISTKTGIPLFPLLEKPQATKSQVSLKRDQRFTNIHGKFTKNPETTLCGNETILLIDDITTTSATLNEAALTIKNHYPKTKIRGLVIARHN